MSRALENRSSRPRQVYLTAEERAMLRECVRIVSEDHLPYTLKLSPERIDRILDDLRFKLRD